MSTEAIHVVGAGGIGCAVGHALLSQGLEVVFVESSSDKVAAGRLHGVRVDQHPARSATFTSFADWSPPADAIVLLCTKCPANATVLPRIPASARLVPIQNGIDPALTRRGPHVEGIASFVSECLPGRPHTRITRGGRLHLGIHGERTADLERLADHLAGLLRRAAFPITRVGDIRPWKYTKLMYNAAIGPLASAAGLDNGALLFVPRLRNLFFALLRENHAILERAGIPLGKVGPLHPATVARILARPWLANALAWVFYPSLRGTYCSMAGDLPGGPTEIDNYNGQLIALAGDHPCPLNRAVHALVRRMEVEHLVPHPDRLEELWGIQAGQIRPDENEESERVAG